MIPELATRADAVVVEVEPRLVPLFARSFADVRTVALGPEPRLYAGRIDAQESLSDVGRHLRTGWQSFPRHSQGYLKADAQRTLSLRERFSHDARALIGLSWISFNKVYGRSKSARLRDFEALLSLPNCRFVDLQYGDTRDEREAIERELGVRVERLPDIDNTQDIDGLAALITACDAVVTVSNTTAHLAGALGRPTWVMVPHGHARFWYWFRDDADSPWYPRVHLKRQARGQSWADLIAAMAPEIAATMAQS
jgi:ADP-heptose:LPS heptosyltransferase